MGYIEENLIPGEEIIARAKLHWEPFVSPLIVAWLVLFLAVLLMTREDTVCCAFLSGFVFLAAVMRFLQAVIIYFTTEFALTNQRIIAKRGYIRQHSLELMLTKVESIQVKQPFVGRLFNYGTIVVTGTGGTREEFPSIASPLELRMSINQQLSRGSVL